MLHKIHLFTLEFYMYDYTNVLIMCYQKYLAIL